MPGRTLIFGSGSVREAVPQAAGLVLTPRSGEISGTDARRVEPDAATPPALALETSSTAVPANHHAPQQQQDMFIRSGVTLHIVNGFVQDGKLFSLLPRHSDELRGSDATPRDATRTYEDASLHLEAQHSTETAKCKPVFTACWYQHSSTQRSHLLLLMEVTGDDIARVEYDPLVEHGKDSELWVDVRESDRGNGKHRRVVSLNVVFPNRTVRDKAHAMFMAAWRQNRDTAQADYAISSMSASALARSTLTSVRALQRQTSSLLGVIREEFTQLSGQRSISDQGNDDDVAERTVVRRQRLHDAQTVLSEIQSRRQSRAATIERLTGLSIASRDEWSVETPAAPINTVSSFSHAASNASAALSVPEQIRSATAAPLPLSADPEPLLRRKSSLSEVPRAAAPAQRLCKHCGEELHSGEARQHEAVCAYRQVRCRKCDMHVKAKDFRKHREEKCPRRQSASSRNLKRSNSDISEVSSSSMEETSDRSSNGSVDFMRRRSSSSRDHALREVPRSDTWADLPHRRSMTKKPSLTHRELQRHNSSTSSFRGSPVLSVDTSSPLSRRQSTVELVESRCPFCDRRAPASHKARCAYRPVRCAICGVEVSAKDAAAHANGHNR